MSINYTDRIPNNVGLSDKPAATTGTGVVAAQLYEVVARDGARRLHHFDVYLRTAVSVETDGWANFGFVKMPEYRWGNLPGQARRRPGHLLRRPPGRAGVAGGPRRVSRPPAAADRDPGRH